MIKTVPGTSSAYAERGIGGYYLDIVPDREALARYGILIQDVQDTIAAALGGQTVTTTVEGRQRFTVNMRYPRDLRDNPKAIAGDILVPMPAGGAVPLGEVATVEPARGPTSIRTENGQLATDSYVDIRDRDIGSYVAEAQCAVTPGHHGGRRRARLPEDDDGGCHHGGPAADNVEHRHRVTRAFWERNLRLKTDSGKDGPESGAPALVSAGMMGDRADVIFAAPEEISKTIERRC
ncbi:hypothetical protein XH87_30410 [Bradyrhizobium sp. CCBAU 53415]|nr:hypothetical protein [Bradyrhizobium sp. CCBAU 53415]